MKEDTLNELYASFADILADGIPIRQPIELVAAIHAAGVDPEIVTADWLKTLNRDWVYGRSMLPFQDAAANHLYQQLLRG